MRIFALVIVSLMALEYFSLQSQTPAARDGRTSTVGYPATIESVIVPGPVLVAKPIEDRRQPLILRIVNTFQHGDGFRYDLEYYGLEPGQFNLADYLQYENGSAPESVPDITVQIDSVGSPDEMPLPNQLEVQSVGFRSYYLSAVLVGGVLWLIGLVAIVFWGRGKTRRRQNQQKQLTVADRLKPLIEKAIDGQLDARGQAELERVLESFWRKKLRIESVRAKDFRERLRQHPEASQMLDHIDAWLHRPGQSRDVNVTQLLEPYKQLQDNDV